MAPHIRDYGAHLGAFQLKIDLLRNRLWSFEIKVLKVHQTSGKALVWTGAGTGPGTSSCLLTCAMSTVII